VRIVHGFREYLNNFAAFWTLKNTISPCFDALQLKLPSDTQIL
jgi:hypothetical protein